MTIAEQNKKHHEDLLRSETSLPHSTVLQKFTDDAFQGGEIQLRQENVVPFLVLVNDTTGEETMYRECHDVQKAPEMVAEMWNELARMYCAECGTNLRGEACYEAKDFHEGNPVCKSCWNTERKRRGMDEDDVECMLIEAINDYEPAPYQPDDIDVQSFKQAELMTTDRGVVLTIGSREFQITITRLP